MRISAVLKKNTIYKVWAFVLGLGLMASINTASLSALENKADTISETAIAPTLDEDKPPSHLIWIIGEITLGVITVVILLIIYSWHLRAVVSKKTGELRKFNADLEDTVEERTADLKAMVAHAEEERKKAKVALESERKAIKQNLNFLDMISHEYRTPLSVISSSIELIQKKCELNGFGQIDGQIKKMEISIQRLIDIFESSLGNDRLDNLAPKLQITTLNLVHIIHSAVQLARTVYTDYQIILKNDVHEKIWITGDERLLVTLFKNILDNACKYSAPQDPVYVMVAPGPDHVTVRTLDSGMGIDEDEAPFVFEKYFRSEHTGKKQGAGLGLYLVKTIVDLHKGDVKLESERHIGTKLSVCLPR